MDTWHDALVRTHGIYNTESEPSHKRLTSGDVKCQCRFLFGKTCTILVSDADIGEGYVCAEERGTEGISAPSSLFYCKPKTGLLKTKVFFF